jgi:cysteinylglycine-S-conjugate dipeptidase
MKTEEIRRRVASEMPRLTEELARLVRIPSVSLPGHDPQQVRRSAEVVREVLIGAGVSDARLIELTGGHPSVAGKVAGPAGAPTVLLYAHHDVQPPGPPEAWRTPPFEPTVISGRMHGRGASDDKVGIAVHAAAVRCLGRDGPLPVTVKFLIEGEEEATAEHLPELFERHTDALSADLVVLADGGQVSDGVPSIETSTRGVVDCVITVRVLEQAQHSGVFGGPVPDALTALCRTLATLHDERGDVAIAGLVNNEWGGEPVIEEVLRKEVGTLPSVEMIGTSSLGSRLFSRPAVSVLGIDCPSILDSSNQLVASASAKVSMRIAPSERSGDARDKLMRHLEQAAPWGVEVEVSGGQAGDGYAVDESKAAFRAVERSMAEAWGREVAMIGTGGTIPFAAMVVEAFPQTSVVITGARDKSSNLHSTNESVDLAQVERLAVSEALLIRDLAEAL